MFSILNYQLADKGFFINLSSSTDRLIKVNKLIEDYNIKNLERFEALTDPLIQYSCTKSHLAIFAHALEQNLETIFVAEDDFHIDSSCYKGYCEKVLFEDTLKLIKQDIDEVEWDIITLGCNPKYHLIPITNNLAIADKSTGAWGYLIKKKAYTYILNNLNYYRDYIAIDDYLPYLNTKGFKSLTTIPMIVGHSAGFTSTLQPRGPVDYTEWIKGNYHYYLYENYSDCNFLGQRIEKDLTVVITGKFVKHFLVYLTHLFDSLPEKLLKCKFIVAYTTRDYEESPNSGYYSMNLYNFFKNERCHVNATVIISDNDSSLLKEEYIHHIRTPHYVCLDHSCVYLKNNKINFETVLDQFNNSNLHSLEYIEHLLT
jgi:GR25 family glycosyltransferase involved in LPS biosynthesis